MGKETSGGSRNDVRKQKMNLLKKIASQAQSVSSLEVGSDKPEITVQYKGETDLTANND